MSNDIFGIAYAMRAASAQSLVPLKLSHAQQCVAAALGYGTLAAYQASPDESSNLAEATHVVIEIDHLVVRSQEIYLPLDVPCDDIPLDGELLEIPISGHVSMKPDVERPYAGHRINISATLALGRSGRAVLSTVACLVESAELDYHWDGEDEDEVELKVSLVEALAEYLGLSFDDASELDDAAVQTLESEDGLVYGHVFDFTSVASKAVTKKIKQKHGSLNVQVLMNFFDRVHGRAAVATRHYVHGDQHEEDVVRFFCQQCDLLVDATHFEAEHPGEAEERYFASLRRWQRRPARAKINLRRPNNVVNVLAANAETARRNRAASRSPFHFWIEEQLGRTDPVGDL